MDETVAADAFARKLAELGAQFRGELPATLAQMQAMAAAGDLDELRMAAHRLAGRGGTFGAAAISEAARRVEEAPSAEVMRELDALASEIAALS